MIDVEPLPPSPWPREDELLLLRAALLDPSRASAAWSSFRALHSGIDHLGYAGYRILPQLSRNLRAIDPDNPNRRRLAGAYRHAWYANQQLLHQGSGAVAALQDAGIPVMLLKGGALVALYLVEVGLRPMDDLDILVSPRDVQRAVRVLAAAGWRAADQVPVARKMRVRHSLALAGPRHAEIDLHWAASFPRSDDSDLWADAVEVSLQGVSAYAPSATDLLLLICAHGVSWGPAPLRWISDALLILRSAPEQVDWEKLIERAQSRRLALDLHGALEFLTTHLDAEVPAEVLRRLRAVPSRPVDRLVYRIKVSTRRSGVMWALIWKTARRWDAARRLAAAPPLAEGAPGGILDYVREEWGLGSRRAVLVVAAAKSLRALRRPGLT